MKFAAEGKFEFFEDLKELTITLITHEENTVFYFPKDYPEDKFLSTYYFFLDYSPSQMHKIMNDIASKIRGARVFSELKPGLTYDWRHKPEFFLNRKGKQTNRDRWSDGMTWEEWCSDKQISKEYFSRDESWKAKQKKRNEIDERPTLDDDWKAPKRDRKFSYEPKPKKDLNLGDMLDDLFN